MKRILTLPLLLSLLVSLAACGNPVAPAQTDETQTPQTASPSATAGIDVDLTVLSSTMVYSEVYNMMMTP